MLLPAVGSITGLVLGGDAEAVDEVLDDRRLAPLLGLPRRTFGDIPEPRRAVLDEIAVRCLTVPITVRGTGARG